jgi:hypothetical protein
MMNTEPDLEKESEEESPDKKEFIPLFFRTKLILKD